MHNDNHNEMFYCRICGLLQLDPPWCEDGQSPSWNICECCGTTVGYQDCNLTAIRMNRKRWLDKGTPWFDKKSKPNNWNLEERLNQIPTQFL